MVTLEEMELFVTKNEVYADNFSKSANKNTALQDQRFIIGGFAYGIAEGKVQKKVLNWEQPVELQMQCLIQQEY